MYAYQITLRAPDGSLQEWIMLGRGVLDATTQADAKCANTNAFHSHRIVRVEELGKIEE